MRTYFRSSWSSIVWRRVVCLVLVIALLIMGTFLVLSGTHAATAIPHPSHVVLVIEENHSYSDIIGSSSAPYINSLAQQGALFTSSFAITHPSEPNYLALFSGSTQGLSDDSCPHTFSGPDLGGELIAASDTFSGYSGKSAQSWLYRVHITFPLCSQA